MARESEFLANSENNNWIVQILNPFCIHRGDQTEGKINGNPIGWLQELCMARRWPPPCYETEEEVGLPHERQFSIACLVATYRETGRGKSKKVAKRLAAQQMWQRLQDLPADADGGGGEEVSLFSTLLFHLKKKEKKKFVSTNSFEEESIVFRFACCFCLSVLSFYWFSRMSSKNWFYLPIHTIFSVSFSLAINRKIDSFWNKIAKKIDFFL